MGEFHIIFKATETLPEWEHKSGYTTLGRAMRYARTVARGSQKPIVRHIDTKLLKITEHEVKDHQIDW